MKKSHVQMLAEAFSGQSWKATLGWMEDRAYRFALGEKSIVECKTADASKADEWEDGKIPREYVFQVQHQMAVTGLERAYIPVVIGNSDFFFRVVKRDDRLIERLLKADLRNLTRRNFTYRAMPFALLRKKHHGPIGAVRQEAGR